MADNDRKYTKGDCYALCEFLDELTNENHEVIAEIATVLGYEFEHLGKLLCRLSSDIDGIIAQEQDERHDTDQMADIMQLVHIPGHNDND